MPVPQFLTDHHLPGGYLFLDSREQELRAQSIAEFQVDVIDRIDNDNVYLKKEYLGSPIEDQLISFLQKRISEWPEVKAVFTKDQLNASPNDSWCKMVAAGYDKERNGELIFLLQPGYLPKSTDNEAAHKGTSHGSAFNYDTHVPVLFYGKGILPQEVFTPYEIVDIAATMVHVLNIQRPNAMVGKPMVELFKRKK